TGNLLKDRESDRHDQRVPPFAMEYFAPRRGLTLGSKREFDSIQMRLDVSSGIYLVGFLACLGAPKLHHQPAWRFGCHQANQKQREPWDGCRSEHHSPIAAQRKLRIEKIGQEYPDRDCKLVAGDESATETRWCELSRVERRRNCCDADANADYEA